jgi:hypothetical protein
MAETPLPPWLTRQYDYATGLRQIGQTVASNLQRNRALELQAQSVQAQQQSAAALEQWRMAQAKALQDKQTQEAADAAEQTLADQQLEVDLSKATDMESRMRAYLRRGVKSKNPNFAQYAQEERMLAPKPPTAAELTQTDRSRFMQLDDELQTPEMDSVPMGSVGLAPLMVPTPTKSTNKKLLEHQILKRSLLGAERTEKSDVPGLQTQQQRSQIAILREREKRLAEIVKPNPTEARQLKSIREQINAIAGIEEDVAVEEAEPVALKEIKLPNGKTYFTRPKTP